MSLLSSQTHIIHATAPTRITTFTNGVKLPKYQGAENYLYWVCSTAHMGESGLVMRPNGGLTVVSPGCD
eukprot:4830384-Amphidinium_carterae.1